MLVSELDFQVVHLFTMAHEAEMSGLDHPGMDGADTHLVNLGSAHGEERVAIHRPLALRLEAHRFEPRVAFGHQAGLLPQFALKNLCGRKFARQTRIVLSGHRVAAQKHQWLAWRQQQRRHDHAGRLMPARHPSEPAYEMKTVLQPFQTLLG